MSKWIRIKDKLPKKERFVDVFVEQTQKRQIDCYYDDEGVFREPMPEFEGGLVPYEPMTLKVTHWMYSPKNPVK